MYVERAFPHFRLRLFLLGTVCLLPLAGLIVRLWVVQVREGSEHQESIKRQSLRQIRLNPVRGRVFAADGRTVLADNGSSFDLVFHVSEMRRPGKRARTVAYVEEQIGAVSRAIGRVLPGTVGRVEHHLRVYPAMPLTAFTELNPQELARVAELLPPVPGLEIMPRIRREYPCAGTLTHVLGFTGLQRPDSGAGLDRFSYVSPELHGRAGIERRYDSVLSGQAGMRRVLVDILGYAREVVEVERPPRNGDDLVLTIDLRAQRAAEGVLAGSRGALVAVDIHTGAVLAMASSPTYDLSTLDASRYAALAADRDERPLVNRAVTAGYTPGSIVKPLIALAALTVGTVAAEDIVVCTGAHTIAEHPIKCWLTSGHGVVDLHSAIEQSCNCFFIEIGLRTTLDRLVPILAAAGIGEDPHIDLPHSASDTRGTLPSREYVETHYSRPWLPIDTAFLSIGQGTISLSPLQAVLYTAAIANGGRLLRPYLVQSVRSPAGETTENTVPLVVRRLPVSAEHLAMVREGMRRVIYGRYGAGVQAANEVITLAGKTGTAEIGSGENRTKNTWFTCFGPLDEPRYAATLVIEEGTSGGKTAAPLIRRFFEEWLGPAPPPP